MTNVSILIRVDFSCVENRGVQRITFNNQIRYWVQPIPTVVSITEFGPLHIYDTPSCTLENGIFVADVSLYPRETRYVYPTQ